MIYQKFSQKSTFFTSLALVFFLALANTMSAQAVIELDDSGTRIANHQTQIDAKGVMEIQAVNQWLPAGVIKVLRRMFPRTFLVRKASSHARTSASLAQRVNKPSSLSTRRKLVLHDK